ncbi:N-acetylglucosamine-6-phosphate deacetylase [Hydrogenoanaerobacterium sp.]|uniref:N-acetylglucosamine-6-phosphate deacetylase n=1 Tax=Hydrogenoanaerobacterium sp. TaxID=2953763 RepID=UPI0028A223BF|nr:N-acetylglucosamine-6-phosphate deacetylase [Hydrogenoanaerobacterium sp.]
MKKILKSEHIFTQSGCVSGYLGMENGKITEILPKGAVVSGSIEDCGDSMLIPGIIDLHSHGFMGKGVWAEGDDINEENLLGYLSMLPSVGVTGVTPTASLDFFEIIASVEQRGNDGAQILGIYSEGPFGTREGENAANHFTYPKPSVEVAKEYVRRGCGLLKIMSIAPEACGADEVIDYLISQGIIVAAYHTNATHKEMAHGFAKGITLVTHTGNVMSGIHHRDIGALGTALMDPNVDCEIIADFFHLCPEMLEIMFKLKDYSKFILVSDSIGLTGLAPGEYTLFGNMTLFVGEDGYIRESGGRLCGSTKPVLFGMKSLHQQLHIPIERVVEMASLNPARKLGIDSSKGSICVGKDADVVVISKDFECIKTFVSGDVAYSK